MSLINRGFPTAEERDGNKLCLVPTNIMPALDEIVLEKKNKLSSHMMVLPELVTPALPMFGCASSFLFSHPASK